MRGGLVFLIGPVNMTTKRGQDGEVVSMAARRYLDFCCLQVGGARRIGEGARRMGEYKFFWMGYERGIHGVGLLVADIVD